VPQPELEQSLTELLAVLATADLDALSLEDLGHRDAERPALERREIVRNPLVHGGATRIGLDVELKGEPPIVARRALPRLKRKECGLPAARQDY